MDAAPATPHVATTAEAIACAVIPGPLPTALHVVLPLEHPPGAPLIPKGALHPKGTSKIL